MAEFAYAVHTDVCTYLLDETGVCLWVLSPAQSTAAAVKACVGAHFVACIDTRVPGALVGEIVEGAAALFVSVNKETGRPALLRTGLIRRVQERDSSQVQALLEPLIEDIDVHFEDEASQRTTVLAANKGEPAPVAPVAERQSETTTTSMELPPAPAPTTDVAAPERQALAGLDRPTVPRQPPLAAQSSPVAAKEAEHSPADLPVAQPPPCPDLPAPPEIPAELPKAAPTLVIDFPKEKAEAGSTEKASAHGPPPLPNKPKAGPPPLPQSRAHTPLPAPLPPPLPTSAIAHTPLPAPLPVAHTPAPPPLPKPQGAAPPPLPGQLAHTPLPPPLKISGHTPGPPPLPSSTDRSPVPPPVWITHSSLPEANPPALPLPPVVVDREGSTAEVAEQEGDSVAAGKDEGAKAGGSRLPKRKSSADNSGSPPTMSSPRARGSQPASRAPKQTGKKVPPPPLPPPRSIAGARSSAFDENAPLPLRRRKKKD